MAVTITSLDEVKSYMAKEDETDADVIARLTLIKRLAEKAVRRYVGSNIVQTTYTHILPQEAQCIGKEHLGEILRLPEYPVRSITSLYEDTGAYAGQADDAFDTDKLLTAGTHFYLAVNQSGLSWFGHVVRLGTNWPAIGGSIKAVYSAGWSADELDGDDSDPGLDAGDIKLAVLKTVAESYNRASQQTSTGGTIQSEKIDDYQVTYDTSDASAGQVELPMDAKLLLAPFRRRSMG